MLDCMASVQSGTAMKKTNVAGTDLVPDQANTVRHFFGSVPDCNYGCQNADTIVNFLDADAELWL
jgi:hypothetical protein